MLEQVRREEGFPLPMKGKSEQENRVGAQEWGSRIASRLWQDSRHAVTREAPLALHLPGFREPQNPSNARAVPSSVALYSAAAAHGFPGML